MQALLWDMPSAVCGRYAPVRCDGPLGSKRPDSKGYLLQTDTYIQ